MWSPAATLTSDTASNPFAFPTVSTNYTVVVTDTNGCEASDDVFVTVNALPVADAGADTSVCDGNLISLNASGGVSYAWSPDSSLTNPFSQFTQAIDM